MPSQVVTSVENNFTKGLVTEYTGLNFPENAATDCDNTTFTLVGGVLRREGIDFETNFATANLGTRDLSAINTYKWNNAGGDGNTQVIVTQVGSTLYFYSSSSSTIASPLSANKLTSTVSLSSFTPTGSSVTTDTITANECQFSDGNGYLFVYHPNLESFYCTYAGGTVTGFPITIKTRDFVGIPETGVQVNFRPPTLNTEHNYNLQNQGWQVAAAWSATSTSSPTLIVDINGNWTVAGSTFQIQAGLPIVRGQLVSIYGHLFFTRADIGVTILGQVSSYSGTTLTFSVINCITSPQANASLNNLVAANWQLTSATSNNQITAWFSALSSYPSNADVWWIYKNTSGVFAPATTINNFPPPTSPAARGHFIVNEYQQSRSTVSNISGITDVITYNRPRTGTWFLGRVWFTGVDGSFQPTGDMPYTTWTENIYFSQIATSPDQFGNCFQSNDPTDENFFNLLPTDGGVIKIQGSGSIYKLFPTQNGMLVFAANGIWFITGSQGIGFSANDYTITKISNIQSISSTSFVNVMGLPYFWNEEGIYSVESAQGSLTVNPITVSTILTFYSAIPKQSKRYVKGAYHPIDYTIQWIYKSTNETNVTDRYTFDRVLNYNVYNKAFFPYTVNTTSASMNGINYVEYPGGSNSPDPGFKYFSSEIVSSNYLFTFAEENNSDFVDWAGSATPVNFTSFFTTGYKVHGQGQRRFSIPYLYTFSGNTTSTSFYLQGLWDYAIDRNSNRWSARQQINNFSPHFGVIFRRHRIRGTGLVMQFKISSVDGKHFNIIGWSVYENQNTSV